MQHSPGAGAAHGLTGGTSLSLFVTHPTGERTEHLLTQEVKVGRLPECDIRVASAFLSRVHFIVRWEGDTLVVVSQHKLTASGSTGIGRVLGTYVNKQLVVGTRPITIGDRISPMPEPGPSDPVFIVGLTQSPTPAEQLPAAPKGMSGMLVGVGCVVLLGIIAAVVLSVVVF
ncbi:MAG: hypothetical protein DRI90_02455 [Deltaproteobacteria bacterium]|nr:MAG: hypothetical protein DRI90_02455 [Deltaproteobacteria bacterium]